MLLDPHRERERESAKIQPDHNYNSVHARRQQQQPQTGQQPTTYYYEVFAYIDFSKPMLRNIHKYEEHRHRSRQAYILCVALCAKCLPSCLSHVILYGSTTRPQRACAQLNCRNFCSLMVIIILCSVSRLLRMNGGEYCMLITVILVRTARQ